MLELNALGLIWKVFDYGLKRAEALKCKSQYKTVVGYERLSFSELLLTQSKINLHPVLSAIYQDIVHHIAG